MRESLKTAIAYAAGVLIGETIFGLLDAMDRSRRSDELKQTIRTATNGIRSINKQLKDTDTDA